MVGESGGDRRFKLFTSRGDVGEETRGGDAVEDFVRRRAHERAAGKGGTVVAGRHDVGDFLFHQHGADGETVRQRFRHRHEIRFGVLHELMSPELTGATQTALDLVVDEERVGVIANLSQTAQKLGVGGVDTTLALHRLHEHRASLPFDDQPSRLF